MSSDNDVPQLRGPVQYDIDVFCWELAGDATPPTPLGGMDLGGRGVTTVLQHDCISRGAG